MKRPGRDSLSATSSRPSGNVAPTMLVTVLLALPASAQLQLVPEETQHVFVGQPQEIRLMWRNPTGKPVVAELKWRLFQVSSATKLPLSEAQSWKKLEVLPGQTVLETLTLTLPEVRAATRFELRWEHAGSTSVIGYPQDLLKRLPPLALHDPDKQLSVLHEAEESPQLIVVWATELPERVEERVKDGLPAVWIKPTPAAVVRRIGRGVVVETPVSSMAGWPDSPWAQLNLVKFAELALEPERLRLPADRQTA